MPGSQTSSWLDNHLLVTHVGPVLGTRGVQADRTHTSMRSPGARSQATAGAGDALRSVRRSGADQGVTVMWTWSMWLAVSEPRSAMYRQPSDARAALQMRWLKMMYSMPNLEAFAR